MRIIDLDATKWTSILDIYNAITPALGAPEGYARSLDGLLELMIWDEVKDVEPPFTIRIFGTANLPREVMAEIEQIRHYVAKACDEFRSSMGREAIVRLETYPLTSTHERRTI